MVSSKLLFVITITAFHFPRNPLKKERSLGVKNESVSRPSLVSQGAMRERPEGLPGLAEVKEASPTEEGPTLSCFHCPELSFTSKPPPPPHSDLLGLTPHGFSKNSDLSLHCAPVIGYKCGSHFVKQRRKERGRRRKWNYYSRGNSKPDLSPFLDINVSSCFVL